MSVTQHHVLHILMRHESVDRWFVSEDTDTDLETIEREFVNSQISCYVYFDLNNFVFVFCVPNRKKVKCWIDKNDVKAREQSKVSSNIAIMSSVFLIHDLIHTKLDYEN